MTKKVLLTISLSLVVLFSLTLSFGATLDVEQSIVNNRIEIDVRGAAKSPVTIVIQDSQRFYYLDQQKTNASGETTFIVELSDIVSNGYDVIVKNEGQVYEAIIDVVEEIEPIIEEASLKITGYNGKSILSKTKARIGDDETVLDFTKRVLRKNGIDYQDAGGYLTSIDALAQFDKGSKSGWMFSINGDFPSVGANQVDLERGDYIEWAYTSDLGEDIGNDYRLEKNNEALDIIEDEEMSDAEVVEAIGDIHSEFKTLVKNKNEKDVLEKSKAIIDVFEKMVFNRKDKEIYEEAYKSVKVITEAIKDFDKSEEKQMQLKRSFGLMLQLASGIESDEIFKDLLETMTTVTDQSKLIEIIAPEKEDTSKISLSPQLLKAIKEKGLVALTVGNTAGKLNMPFNLFYDLDSQKTVDIEIDSKKEVAEAFDKNLDKLKRVSPIVEVTIKKDQEVVHVLEGSIEISIPLKGTVEGSDTLNVYWIKPDGTKVVLESIYDDENNQMVFTVDHLSQFVLLAQGRIFNDLEGHWAKETIETLANQGLINGFEDGNYYPKQSITRGEFIALVVRALSEPPQKTTVTFEDVQPKDWFYDSVKQGYGLGIITGKSETIFDPNSQLTRSEMIQMLGNVLMYKEIQMVAKPIDEVFEENNEIPSWVQSALNRSIQVGLIKGDPSHKLYLEKQATRAESAVVIKRLLEVIDNLGENQ